jgi:hypothetical protein
MTLSETRLVRQDVQTRRVSEGGRRFKRAEEP